MRSFLQPRVVFLLTLAVLMTLGAARADAQWMPGRDERDERQRPFRGLFGSSADPDREHQLTLGGSLFGGYDGNILADQPGGGIGTPSESTDGSLVGASMLLTYGKRARRVEFGATFNTSAQYYPTHDDLTSSAYGGGAALIMDLSRRTRLGINQSVAYQPYYQLSPLFPGLGDPVLGGGAPSNLDFAVSRSSGWLYSTGVQLDRQLGRRSTLMAFYGLTRSDFEADPSTGLPIYDLDVQAGGFRFTREMTRYASLNLGYAYRRGNYGGVDADLVEGHDIDVGVDYARELSLSRRTRFSFSTGTAITSTLGVRQFNVVGNAALRHEIGRTWLAQLAYNRGVGFIGSFAQPVLSDGVGASLNGLLGRRVSLTFSAGYASGKMGLDSETSESSRFSTANGNASVQYAFTSMLAAFAQYSYFYYDFPVVTTLPLTGEEDRHSVRVGLTVSLPLLR